jgi:hypothetical protein
MHIGQSLSIRVGSRIALAAAALPGFAPVASAQSSENLIVAFTQGGASQAVPLSPGLTIAIAIALALTAWVILRRRVPRGNRLLAWLLGLCAAALAVAGAERAISEAQAVLPPAGIALSVSPGMLQLNTYWQSNVNPLTVTVTNSTGNTVRITSVSTDNTNLYLLSTPTTCTVGTSLAPQAQCTVTLSIQ